MQEAADDGGDLAFANALDLGAAPLGYDRLDDDWTLSAQHAPNILGGQVQRLHTGLPMFLQHPGVLLWRVRDLLHQLCD